MLINLVLGHSGCQRSRLEIKLFGGANFTQGVAMVGKRNSDFVLHYLANEGLRVHATDLGGIYGRRIHYHPASGKVKRLFLMGASEKRAEEEERRYQESLREVQVEGTIQLFD
jgi:chemotaxis protein CheD